MSAALSLAYLLVVCLVWMRVERADKDTWR